MSATQGADVEAKDKGVMNTAKDDPGPHDSLRQVLWTCYTERKLTKQGSNLGPLSNKLDYNHSANRQ